MAAIPFTWRNFCRAYAGAAPWAISISPWAAAIPFQINGARAQDTNVTIDGANAVRTRGNGAIIGVANVDAIAEIQVMTADYSAEYGRAAGGQIRMVSKSGTRDFHGSASEYFRNSDLNANTWAPQPQHLD